MSSTLHRRGTRGREAESDHSAADRRPALGPEGLGAGVDGGSEAFADLYRRNFHDLYDFAARITRDRAAAADVVQTAFAKAWERTRAGEEVEFPRAWLFRVTHNAAVDELRRRRWTTGAEGDHEFEFAAVDEAGSRDPERRLIDKDMAELVWAAAERLRPDEYALLDLYVRRGLDGEELADHLGISTGALYTRLSRLRRSFEEALTLTLLLRRGSRDCEYLADRVSALGADVDTPEGQRSLRVHVRNCQRCQEARRRHVTASAILAGLAPVPLAPGTAAAIWAHLVELLGFATAAGGGMPRAANDAHAATPAGRASAVARARTHPLAIGGLGLALALLVAGGVWSLDTLLDQPSSTAPARDPTHVWSPTHDAGEPSTRSRVRIAWSRQPDATAYSVLWGHTRAAEPDTDPDLPGSATGTTSPVLSPGRWYFHLRTRGAADAWTHTVHLGPFAIEPPAPADGVEAGSGGDSGEPPAPAAPESESPSPGATVGTTTAPPVEQAPSSPADGGSSAPSAADSTPPSRQAAELRGGPYYRRLAVPLVLTSGVDRESGVDPASGVLQRSSAVLADGACGAWSRWSVVVLRGSSDTTVTDGRCYRYRYRVSDRAGNRSAFSAPSGTAAVDATPPSAPTLSVSEHAVDSLVVDTTIYYRPAGAGGTFVVAAASADGGSGVAAVEFPALTAGMAPTTRTRRAARPHAVEYRWRPGAAEGGVKLVVVYDAAGNSARARFTIAADGTGPGGASVSLVRGPWFVGPVALAVEPGSDAGSGVDAGSVVVERESAALVRGACEPFTGVWTRVTLDGGSDSSATSGRCYRYRLSVSDRVGNRSTSAASAEARVDATPPASPLVSLRPVSGAVHAAGTTLFYRPDAAGSFAIEATADDPESGIESAAFPTLAGATGGGLDRSAPFGSTYGWHASFGASGTQAVTVTNGAGTTATGAFTLVPDGDGPGSMRVGLVGGPWFSGSIALDVDLGTEDGSGVDARSQVVERDQAPLAGGSCGPFSGAWTAVALHAGADTSAAGGGCYRYRVSVSDMVGNRSTSSASAEARVDATGPPPPVLSLRALSGAVHVAATTVFYRPEAAGSFAVGATVDDPDSGIASVSFPSLAGASGGGSDLGAPFETTYDWGVALTGTGPQPVIASNGSGVESDSVFVLTADAVGPTGISIRLLAGPTYPGGAVPLAIDVGSDDGSGIDEDSLVVERDAAALLGVDCDVFTGAWTPAALHGAADTDVEAGTCYRYRARVSDNVGNVAISPPSGNARVV